MIKNYKDKQMTNYKNKSTQIYCPRCKSTKVEKDIKFGQYKCMICGRWIILNRA